MSDLQIALIILGAFIIAGVVVYNWMQERKLRKEVTSEFIVPQKDVLTEDFYIDADAYVNKELAEIAGKIKSTEHTFSAEAQSAPQVEVFQDAEEGVGEALQPVKAQTEKYTAQEILPEELQPEPIPPGQPEPIVQATLHEKLQGMQANLPDSTHPQIDLTAILYATKDISGKELSTLKASIGDIGLPLAIHGLDKEDKWHVVDESSASATFKQVACSLQLADRGGPIAKKLLNKFQFAIEEAGLELNAHVEWQGSGDAMQRAIELDQFCIEVDQMISVHIAQGDTPIHGTKFKGLAEANGLQLKGDGKFHYLANGKDEPLFVLIDTNSQPFTAESLRSNVLKSVTFQIEIPKVNNCEQVFNQMILMAQKMATSLNGRLVDDNQKPLGDLQIEKIRQQLKVIHATMVARGIMPGSPGSMRLFS
ncbi:MAG: cell division protein ZipA C-terminal FtsZ-binding domain-containing protein [Methylotenera sp.]